MSKIYNFIGQPGSGKTTLARLLKKYHLCHSDVSNKSLVHIDGDDIRDIFQNKDYTEKGRRINIQRAYDIATFLNSKNYTVVISLISPYIDIREEFKKNPNVIEIYTHTTDIRGKEKYHVLDFQIPINNFIDVDTTNAIEEYSLKQIIEKLNENIIR